MAAQALTAPEKSGSREKAQELVKPLPADLSNAEIIVDLNGVFVTTPSFVDELIKQVLVDRQAKRLCLRHATERTAMHAHRAARIRGVQDKLVVK